MRTVSYHLQFYQSFLVSAWDNISPMQYGVLLVTIGIIGWALMKSGASQ